MAWFYSNLPHIISESGTWDIQDVFDKIFLKLSEPEGLALFTSFNDESDSRYIYVSESLGNFIPEALKVFLKSSQFEVITLPKLTELHLLIGSKKYDYSRP